MFFLDRAEQPPRDLRRSQAVVHPGFHLAREIASGIAREVAERADVFDILRFTQLYLRSAFPNGQHMASTQPKPSREFGENRGNETEFHRGSRVEKIRRKKVSMAGKLSQERGDELPSTQCRRNAAYWPPCGLWS
jgi:hypothetical protein